METKRNLKYYLKKGLSIPLIIGLAIIVVGIVFFMIRSLKIFGIIGIVIGISVLIFSSGGAATDTDLDFACHEKTKDIEEEAEKKFEVFERSFLRMIRPVALSGFQFVEGDNFYCRKGSDGRHRSTMFGSSIFLFTNEKMYFYKKSFSLIDAEIDNIDASVVYYTKLDHCELQEGEYTYIRNNKQYTLKTWQFVVIDVDGNEVYRMFIDFGADAEKAVDDINHVFQVRKKAAADRAAEKEAERLAREAAAQASTKDISTEMETPIEETVPQEEAPAEETPLEEVSNETNDNSEGSEE